MGFWLVFLLFLASSLVGAFIVLAPFRKQGKKKRSKASSHYPQGQTASGDTVLILNGDDPAPNNRVRPHKRGPRETLKSILLLALCWLGAILLRPAV